MAQDVWNSKNVLKKEALFTIQHHSVPEHWGWCVFVFILGPLLDLIYATQLFTSKHNPSLLLMWGTHAVFHGTQEEAAVWTVDINIGSCRWFQCQIELTEPW